MANLGLVRRFALLKRDNFLTWWLYSIAIVKFEDETTIYYLLKNWIEIVQEDGTSETFAVPMADMITLVRSFYGTKVIAIGVRDAKGRLLLQDIHKVKN